MKSSAPLRPRLPRLEWCLMPCWPRLRDRAPEMATQLATLKGLSDENVRASMAYPPTHLATALAGSLIIAVVAVALAWLSFRRQELTGAAE